MAVPQDRRTQGSLCKGCLVLLVVTVAVFTEAVLADSILDKTFKTPPTKLVIYEHEDRVDPGRSVVTAAAPGGDYDNIQFGTINVVANVLRVGLDKNSPKMGKAYGQVTFEDDLSISLAFMFALNTTSYHGTLTAQGNLDANGNGQVVITGGTYDFRFARGYAEVLTVSSADQGDVVFRNTLTLKYD